MSQWTLFSNHGHVLLFIAREPEARLRDIAEQVGITERAVQKIIKDLQVGGFITVRKHGRRNRYRVQMRKSLRHTLESHCSVGELVRLIHEDLPATRPADSGVSGAGSGPVSEHDMEDDAVEAPGPGPIRDPEADPGPAPALQEKTGEKAKPRAGKKGGKKPPDDSQGSLF